jgi:flagellar FliL protein
MKALPAPARSPAPAPSTAARAGGLVLVTALAAATGAGIAYTIADVSPKPRAEAASGARPAETGAVVRLAPLVTNLARPTDTWIRLEGSLILDGPDGDKARVLAAEIGGDLMAYLRTLHLPQLEGASGLQALREDLAERVRLRSGGKVRELVIETLVVQ